MFGKVLFAGLLALIAAGGVALAGSGVDGAGSAGEGFVGAGRPFRLGLNADNWNNQVESADFRRSVRDMGIEFIVWHVSPEEFSNNRIRAVIDYCRAEGLSYLFNTELVNYVQDAPEFRADNGGAIRWDFPDAVLEPLRDDPLFLGVVHDESLLMQAYIGKGGAGPKLPPYVDASTLSPEEAFSAVAGKIDALSARYAGYGKRLVLENLFPDEAFVTARGGAVQAPKLLKENYSDLMTMTARGAARQYLETNEHKGRGAELWACVDLWYLDGFPGGPAHGMGKDGGHGPEGLYRTLVYAWRAGYDAVYIEQAKGVMDPAWKLIEHGRRGWDFDRLRRSRPRPADWRTINRDSPVMTVRRFPSGNPGGSMPEFLDLGAYGSKEYRFQDCRPGVKPMSPWCARDMEWFALFDRLTGPAERSNGAGNPAAGLGGFPGLTFNTRSYARPFALAPERTYTDMAGLPEIQFVDHYSSPPGRGTDGGRYVDLYGSGIGLRSVSQ